jgi:hypothetical protein
MPSAAFAAATLWRRKSTCSPLQKARQTVLDLLLRLKNGVLVVDQQPLQLCVLYPDGVGDLAIVEDVPLERRPEAESYALSLEYLLELVAVDIAGHRSKSPE